MTRVIHMHRLHCLNLVHRPLVIGWYLQTLASAMLENPRLLPASIQLESKPYELVDLVHSEGKTCIK